VLYDVLNLEVYGVTLLAFGNGAPDVFSALSAVQNMKNNDVGLLFGALLGIKPDDAFCSSV